MVSIQWELCWLVLDMSPYLISSDRMDAWHSAAKQGKMILTIETCLVGAYQTEIDRGYHSVTPCLYTKGKSVWTGETSGCHARAVVLWEKGVTG